MVHMEAMLVQAVPPPQASALLGLGALTSASPVTSAGGCAATFAGDGSQSGSVQDLTGTKVGTDYNGALTADYVRPVMNGMLWMTSLDVNFTDGYQMIGGSVDPRLFRKPSLRRVSELV